MYVTELRSRHFLKTPNGDHWTKKTEQICAETFDCQKCSSAMVCVDLRETFPQADPVPIKAGENTTLTVFNLGRNVRLITFVEYTDQTVSIRRVLIHDEYMSNKWKR